MKTTINNKLLSRTLFFSLIFFITVFFADWFGGVFFFNRNFRIVKFILCILVPFLTVRFNFIQEKSLRFIGKSSEIIMFCFVVFFLLFNLLRVSPFLFNEMSSQYHIAYALVCIFSVFAAATFFAHKNKNANYGDFYNSFFLGYIPMMIMLYCLFYFNYRNAKTDYSVNLIPFKGEFSTLFNDFTSLSFMRTLGNVAFYSTVALAVSRFCKKHTALLSFIVPFAICILTEIAQGMFNIGDADIDDVILNGAGALIGALIYKYIIEKLRSEEKCSE